MSANDVDWLTEAITTAFAKTPENNGTVYAWQESVPVLDIRSEDNQREIREWVDHLSLLKKREIAASQDIQLFRSDAIRGFREAQENAQTANKELQLMKKRLWENLKPVKDAVAMVHVQVSNSVPGDPNVAASLAQCMDAADLALGEFKKHQSSAYRILMEEEERLQAEIEVAAHIFLDDDQNAHFKPPQQSASIKEAWGPIHTKARAAPKKAIDSNGKLKPLNPEDETKDLDSDDPVSDAESSDSSHCPAALRRSSLHAASGPSRRGGTQQRRGHISRSRGCLAPEVAAFEEFVLRHGGDSGGWDKEDHEEFVRVVKACAGDYTQAVDICMDRVIGYTRNEVMQHAHWHMDYMDLLVRKRAALRRWREQKEVDQAKLHAQAALLSYDAMQMGEDDHSAQGRRHVVSDLEKQVQKQQVQQWKQEKAFLQAMRDSEAAEHQKRIEERKRIEAEDRQRMNKIKLEFHKQVKEQALRQIQLSQQQKVMRESSCNPDPAQAWRLKQRSVQLLQKKHELVTAKENQLRQRAEVQAKLLEEVHIDAPSDPNRFLKGTSAHIQRLQARQQEEVQAKQSGFILKMGGRVAVPSWRAGLS
ncbi:hypothetical protein CEUSTIGMA_g9118.t1 [Chlamydomonas eustigma]|uniref:Uncharacterized protein n=1 Tax=Chlamydomonas eustigma TaxID=1157962 RepID=A0A250XFX4_9CHLO|nr:hypothetical protein CEUSTIGMA_g9118.t1 [Chlamydomonas eustigma]|eukprot:GAX81690.1 hypothetical protein CEUSTIGMA_g9118.t1 [Chlamydomonas eustigma]